MGSWRGEIPRVRSEITERLIKELGMSLAEVGRLLGVSTSVVSKILHRTVLESRSNSTQSTTACPPLLSLLLIFSF
jgi:predicted transcriptional regulator